MTETAQTMFTIIINPEYWALKELLILAKSVAK